MSDFINQISSDRTKLSLQDSDNHTLIASIGYALSSTDRLRILSVLSIKAMSVSELSEVLDMAISSVSYHVNILHDAQLVAITYQPGIKGHKKLCSKSITNLHINMENTSDQDMPVSESVEMPIGNYVFCDVKAPCGIAGRESHIVPPDDPQAMFNPKRTAAQLLWFASGYVSYIFPNHFFKKTPGFQRIRFSMEICSETFYYCNVWPSDITFWINDIELFTYTCPGDFGGRQGKFSPDWWFVNSTQYGLLKEFIVDTDGVHFDGKIVNSSVTFSSLRLSEGVGINLKIGIKPDAEHVGGINLFGKYWGDHPQAIVMTLSN